MSEHPNAELMRSVLDAFMSGNTPALGQYFAEDVVWHVPGKSELAGSHRGQYEVFGFFGKLLYMSNGTFKVENIDIFADENGGVYVDRITAERGPKSLDVLLCLRVTIRDGKIVEGWDCFHQEHLWDEFWA